MIGLNLDKQFYVNLLGISCVEKSLLGYLRFIGFPYQALFLESFINIDDVLDEFINNNVSYIDYKGLKRLQIVARDLKIANITYVEANFEKMLNLSNISLKKNLPILVRVKSDKLPKAKLIPWAGEHYILLYKSDSDIFYLLNEYPLAEYELNKQELKNVYDGAILNFEISSVFDEEAYKKYIRVSIDKRKKSTFIDFKYEIEKENINFYRDAIGILKISHSQLKEHAIWVNRYYKTAYFTEESIGLLFEIVKILNSLFMNIEYARLRNNSYTVLNELLVEFIKKENKLIKSFK